MNFHKFQFFLGVAASSIGQAAISFDFDFSGAVATYNAGSNSLVIDVEDIATGIGAPKIDLRIESITPYFPRDDSPSGTATGLANNGTPAGTDDLRIHLGAGESTSFRFSLFDGAGANAGTFSTLFNPGDNFAYRLVTYDLDGNSSFSGGADYLSVSGPFGYALSANSDIQVTDEGGGNFLFEADGVGEINGQAGIQDFTTGDGPGQLPISVYLEFNNISSFEFTYSVPNDPLGSGTGRNLLFDANDIEIGDFGENPTLTYVPELNNYSFLVGILALGFILRRRV